MFLLRSSTYALPLVCALFSAPGYSSDVPPVDGTKLFEWLKSGQYKHWAREAEKHPSAGPHPSAVIAYLNSKLDESLTANSKSHPSGSAAVKELFSNNGELSGWAVSVKTDEDSQAGKGWYWYEILGTEPDARVVADGNGVPLCFGCHTPGKDFVLIPHPLE